MTPVVPSFDYGRLHQEAQFRWLKASEIVFILQNHERFSVEEQAPEKPLSGSLFLFNRRVNRYFRKDGHMWRRKKDGRSVGEAHERLKVGNVDALNCYYAHGEKNPFFQRRIYWMLDPAYDHIVLVHYREVAEGRFLSRTFLQQAQEQVPPQNFNPDVNKGHLQRLPSSVSEIDNTSQSFGSEDVINKYTVKASDPCCLNMINCSENSDLSSKPEVNQALRELEEQLSLDKYDSNLVEHLSSANINEYEKLENPALLNNEKQNSSQKFLENILSGMDCYDEGTNEKQKCPSLAFHEGISRKTYPSWNDMLELGSSSTGFSAHIRPSNSIALVSGLEPSSYPSTTGTLHCVGNSLNHGSEFQQFASEKDIFGVPFDELEEFEMLQLGHAGEHEEHIEGELCTAAGSTCATPTSEVVSVRKENFFDLKDTIDSPNKKTAYSSNLLDMCQDQGQHGISLSIEPSLVATQKQLFKIHEISPEWSFSFERTKVIITGDFIYSPSYTWAVMFGDIEVPAEIIQQGVLRCQTPKCATQVVTLYITSGNGEACSDVREFEFRTKPINSSVEAWHFVNANKNSEELLLLVKFVHTLLCQHGVSPVSNGAVQSESDRHRNSEVGEGQWQQIIDQLQAGCEISSCTMDWVLQELIKDKFQHWISSKINAKKNFDCLLSKEEQGIIHMISGLGYEWALNPTLDAGVGINVRDVNGWTALHWAARFGREKMAASLLASGALPGAVTDPTPDNPVGKTPGAIASSSGHRGLAGYLSEADLTSHLSSLTMEECQISKGSAAMEAEKAVECISQRTAQLYVDGTEDELSLQDSLAAVRNAAQAAARIQAAFRAHSFRKRQEIFSTDWNEFGMTSKELYDLTLTRSQRTAHSNLAHKFNKAALSIQKKYRSWKGRKDYLNLRHHVVKIQAHVRGHQARKRYREFLWTVGVFEKGVLRWRRRGLGLRGFRPEPSLVNEGEEEEIDIIKAFRKQKVDKPLEQAFSRVLSMVESPRARQQYRRMLLTFHEAKARECTTEEAISWLHDNLEVMEDDEFLHWFP